MVIMSRLSFRRNAKCFIFLFLVILVCYAMVSNIWTENEYQDFTFVEDEVPALFGDCKRPKLELWPEDIKKIYNKLEKIHCSDNDENMASFQNGKFVISPKILESHGEVECRYNSIIRLDGDMGVGTEETSKPIKNGDDIPSDIISVRCATRDGRVDSRVIPGVKPKAAEKKNNDSSLLGGLGLNVLMFGFDSVSRLTWKRSLRRSYDFFVNELGGVVLEGYNILGDGTPQALLPILTGKTEEELPEARRGFPNAKSVDDHPWIWKDFKSRGYATQWGEDGVSFGTFTYRMLGFAKQPVDHYLRPFYLADKSYHESCFGSVSSHQLQLDYVKEFVKVYGPERKKFSFLFHSDYSHGSSTWLQNADEDLLDHLKWLKDSGALDDTLLILMSDHGARFTTIRSTEQGKYEERLPFFALRLPSTQAFSKKFPDVAKQLRRNSQLLTTPFDIHETMMDVLKYEETGEMANLTRPYPRGMSLFRNLPSDRNCEDAAIMAHWCTCMRGQEEPTDAPLVKEAAEEVVRAINEMLSEHREVCAEIKLFGVKEASVVRSRSELLSFKGSLDMHGRQADFSDAMKSSIEVYQVKIVTSPNEAVYDSTVTYDLASKRMSTSSKDISRINAYGKQPQCVADKHPHLRAYCFCT